jgi:tripartite-type tricarboxylate transporter receptor subunit TctC
MADLLVRMSPWIAVAAPARTPTAVVRKLQQSLAAAMVTPDLGRLLRELSMEAGGSTPEQFAAQLNIDFPMTTRLIREAGVMPD